MKDEREDLIELNRKAEQDILRQICNDIDLLEKIEPEFKPRFRKVLDAEIDLYLRLYFEVFEHES